MADDNEEDEEKRRKSRSGRERTNGHTKTSLINTDKETQPCSEKNHLMYLLVFLFVLTALGQVTYT